MSDALKELRDIALDRKESEKRSLNGVAFAAGDVWKDEHNGCWIANIEEVGTGNNHVAAQAVSRDIDEAERRRDVMLAALAAPASPLPEGGGWRTDFENAPKDGRWIVTVDKWKNVEAMRWSKEVSRFNPEQGERGWIAKNGYPPNTRPELCVEWSELPVAPTGEPK